MFIRLLAILAAALPLNLSLPGDPLPFLILPALAPLFVAVDDAGPWKGAVIGIAFGLVFALSSQWFFYRGLIDAGQCSRFMSGFSVVFYCFLQSLPYALFGLIAGINPYKDDPLFHPLRKAVLLTLLLCFFPTPLQFTPAAALYKEIQLIQIVDLGGEPLLIFAVIAAGACFAGIFQRLRQGDLSVTYPFGIIFIFLVLMGYGTYRLDMFKMEKILEAEEVPTAVGAVVSSSDKAPNTRGLVSGARAHRYVDFTAAPAGLEPYDCQDLEYLTSLGAPLVARCTETTGKKKAQAVAHLDQSGHMVRLHRKTIALPAVETYPAADIIPWSKYIFSCAGNRKTGSDVVPLDMPRATMVFPAVAEEAATRRFYDAFPRHGRRLVLTLADSPPYGARHSSGFLDSMLVLRAVEHRIPIIRIARANSAVIDPTGSYNVRISEGDPIEVSTAPREIESCYCHNGDLFLYGLLVFFLIDITQAVVRLRKRHKRPY